MAVVREEVLTESRLPPLLAARYVAFLTDALLCLVSYRDVFKDKVMPLLGKYAVFRQVSGGPESGRFQATGYLFSGIDNTVHRLYEVFCSGRADHPFPGL